MATVDFELLGIFMTVGLSSFLIGFFLAGIVGIGFALRTAVNVASDFA